MNREEDVIGVGLEHRHRCHHRHGAGVQDDPRIQDGHEPAGTAVLCGTDQIAQPSRLPRTPPPRAPADPQKEYLAWLRTLTLAERIKHDRAYGKAFFEGSSKHQCQLAGRVAVERRRGSEREAQGERAVSRVGRPG